MGKENFCEQLDEKADAFVGGIVPEIYKRLETAKINYDEELLCLSLADGFKAGYMARDKECDECKLTRNKKARRRK